MKYYVKKKMSIRKFRRILKNKRYNEFWEEINSSLLELKEQMRKSKKKMKWDSRKTRKNLRKTKNNLGYILSLPEDERTRILTKLCEPESEQEK
ncbi:hypothetical protein [Aggregatibacter kilianii]|uniref:hypothetical protein n=1 Tax=Aggregatibacter kilianii TaxID=2025884 RepID=UPI0013A60769|nr:hypothetical protein [Aggregatibacter kilianii]